MKSLGKKEVVVSHYLDDVLKTTTLETRTVYHSAKEDKYYVNYLDGKRQVTKTDDNTFEWHFKVYKIRATSVEEMLSSIKGKSGSTGKVNLTSLF